MRFSNLGLRILERWVGSRIVAMVGAELPPPPFVVTANHTSYFDHFVIGYWLLKNGKPFPRFLSKAELFESPFSAWFNRLGGGIPVARGKVDTEAFEKAKAVLERGGVFIMYAEGTRSRDGWLRVPRRGIASLAAEAAVPVVPVGILGADQVLPVGRRWPRRRRRIVVNVGGAVAAPTGGREEEKDFVRGLFQDIAGLTAQWPGFVSEPRIAATPHRPSADRRAAVAASFVERGLALLRTDPGSERALRLFRRAVALTRGSRDAGAVLQRGRALGQLTWRRRNPFIQLRLALASRRDIWRALEADPSDPLAWHVWASLMEQLPSWLGGDRSAAVTGHRTAAALGGAWHRGLLHLVESYRSIGRNGDAGRWHDYLIALPVMGVDDLARHHAARAMKDDGK